MIHYFKHFRRRFSYEGQTSRYLKYAIGEIILVVIGILIALQINNWNEHRKELKKELIIVQELYKELQQNLKATTAYLEQVENRNEEILFLLNISQDSLKTLSSKDLSLHIFKSTLISGYTPINQKLNKILSLENFRFSHSNDLLNELQAYNNSVNKIESANAMARDVFRNRQVLFFSQTLSIKNIMHDLNPDKISKSEHDVDVAQIIKSMAFENLYADLFASGRSFETNLNQNIEFMHDLIKHIEETYPTAYGD